LVIVLSRQFSRSPYVPLLLALVAAAKEDHNIRPLLDEINAVAGAIVHSHFRQPATKALAISQVAKRDALYPRGDASLGSFIAQPTQPVIEFSRSAHFNRATV
jgi:hypothetical protein